ncbi:restriction endonuclease subunit S [Methylobacter svalbardensis]|uniref:restriction endonuclease subunit S n=1 Tax=Methylobacter svalbardensis TaxID=3080016 RepID=UPI0030EC3FD2
MDTRQFLAEFGHIANAHGGIVRLREMINILAVQGKLVQQDSAEESAELFLVKSGNQQISRTQRRRSGTPAIQTDSVQLPNGWSMTQLQTLANPQAGFAFKSNLFNENRLGMPIIRVRDVGVNSPRTYFSGEYRDEFLVSNGDWLVAMDGDFRVAVWSGSSALLNQRVTRLQFYSNEISKKYVCIALQFQLRKFQGIKNYTTVDHLSGGQIASARIPLPPPKEQSRIVAKVDELMALCDKLEAQQQDRRKLQNNLRQSTLQAVATASCPHELQTSWTRLADNFGRLFHAPEDVVAFKGLILDLAMSGLLLNIEHRHASTGAELIDAIAARRIAWSKDCVDQEQKEVLAMLKKLRIQQINIPDTALPEHWAWASLLQVSQAVVDCHNKTAPYVSEGIHLIRTTDIRNGQMDLTNTRKISEETYAYWARRMPPKSGDIFFTREAPMGEASIVPEGEKVCLGQRSMLIRLFPDLFSNRFLLYVIQSLSFQNRMIESAIGMTVKHLRVGGVEDLIVPVPPKSEQDRIVAIVEEIFRLCDHYADQLTKKQRIATNLASSMVASITGIATEQEEEPMKAPQTELIAPLLLGNAPGIKEQSPLATILARHNGEMPAKDLWQRFGGEIDAFYAQLKTEVAHGWIREPAVAEMREKRVESADA